MKLVVIQGKTKYTVDVADDATFRKVKDAITEMAGIQASSQKLISKGKERKDAETLASAGAKDGDKVMLMLSEAGHKEAAEAAKRAEQSKSRDLSTEAAKLKEQHRDGAGPANAGDKRHDQASSGVSVLEGEGTKEEGAFLVHATRGKTRCTVAASPDSTFGDVKLKIEPLIKIKAKNQRLIFKGKQREDSEVLKSTGACDSGVKMILMVTEGQHKANEEKEILNEAEEELVSVEERAARLENQLKHGMLDSTDAAIKINMCLEAWERLSDNISYLVREEGGLPGRVVLEQRLETLKNALIDLNNHYVLVKRS